MKDWMKPHMDDPNRCPSGRHPLVMAEIALLDIVSTAFYAPSELFDDPSSERMVVFVLVFPDFIQEVEVVLEEPGDPLRYRLS
jgi:hypothetical protein